jgi:hypothetical protein
MPNPTFRRWTADDIAKLKDLAQRHPRAEIAAKLGRSVAATSLKAHELKLSLRMRDPGDEVQRGRGAAGMVWAGQTSMSKTTKALKKQAATAQSAASRTPDAYLSGQMTTLAMAFRAQAEVLKKKRKKQK